MTYLQFHLVFVLPALALVAIDTLRARARRAPLARPPGRPGVGDRFALVVLVAHVAIALIYTTPWDNYLVFRGVWGYPDGRVLGTIGYVPVEEYLFFVLQTLLTGLWLLALARRGVFAVPAPVRRGPAVRVVGTVAGLALTLVGVLLLTVPWGLYLGLILAWAAPVLALQWALGGDLLASRPRWLALVVGAPSLYLMAADRYAIHAGIWWIRPDATTGIHVAGLPLEEGAFFLVTNLLIGFGMSLALDARSPARLQELRQRLVAAGVGARSAARALRRGRSASRGGWWRGALGLWALSMVPAPLAPAAFPVLAYLSTALLAVALLGLARERIGPRAYLAFAVAVVFGWAVEGVGSRTGIPFGAYRYTAPGPSLGGVPLLVPLGWWAFTALAVAVVPGRWRVVAAPLALVAWDLGLDPLMVRQGFWVFDAPGPYYGVPWTNFLGWAVAGAVLVALLERIVPGLSRLAGPTARGIYAAQAGFMGLGLALFGMPVAAMASVAAMGAVMVSWWSPAPLPGPEPVP